MQLEEYKYIYFLGIGGIGMSAIAQWCKKSEFEVFGYDRTQSEITKTLQKLGISIAFSDELSAIPNIIKNNIEQTLVIYTPAIPKEHKGFNFFKDKGYKILKRAEALGNIIKGKSSIGIAGTHGKTSISATTAWLLNNLCTAFLGGVSKNLNSNVIISPQAENVVVEADEFDRSFLTLYPQIAVISAIDADHLDIYEDKQDVERTFNEYIKQIKPNGILIYKNKLDINRAINPNIKYYTYSLDAESDFCAENIAVSDGFYTFNLKTPTGIIEGFKLGVPGLFNLENAVAALAVSLCIGECSSNLIEKLASYQGVKRRFDYQIRSKNLIYIDDYAHHPVEIESCYRSLRHLYPNKKITGIFQPHLFTRTRDFAADFAKSLDLFDQVVLTDIYPAREKPINGVSSYLIFEKMNLKNKKEVAYGELVKYISETDSEVYVSMGAGDIDLLVEPIKNELTKKLI